MGPAVDLATPVRGVVGDKASKLLADVFDIRTVGELLEHYPRRLEDRGELTDFSHLQLDEHVTVLAKTKSVEQQAVPPQGRRPDWPPAPRSTITDGERDLLLHVLPPAVARRTS